MLQLKMLRPSAPVISRSLPEGYTFSTYRGTKAEVTDWLEICLHGQLITPEPPEGRTYEEWFNVTILEFADVNPSEDVIFVLDDTGRPVATLCAIKHGEDINVSPGADYEIMPGDIMELLGDSKALNAVQKL